MSSYKETHESLQIVKANLLLLNSIFLNYLKQENKYLYRFGQHCRFQTSLTNTTSALMYQLNMDKSNVLSKLLK